MTDSPGPPEELQQFGERPIPVPTKGPIALEDALDLGNLLEFLRLAAIRGDMYSIGTGDDGAILDTLQRVENILKTSTLETTVTGEIVNFIEEAKAKYQPEESIDQADREYLKQKSVAWHHLLKEVLAREQRIPAENTGLLDVDRLIESPEQLFSTSVWSWLDDGPRADLEESCKSIVVGSATASVMLSLRAVEHCLRVWYEKENEPIEAAWGQVLDRLMEEYSEEEKKNDTVATRLSDLPPVLSNLYYLKEKRNEVNHPEKSPNPQEARRTLMIVASTITDIYNEVYEDKVSELRELEDFQRDAYQAALHQTIDEDSGVDDYFYRTIRKLDEGEGAHIEDVHRIGRGAGFTDDELQTIIQDLLMSGRVYEPSEQRLKAI